MIKKGKTFSLFSLFIQYSLKNYPHPTENDKQKQSNIQEMEVGVEQLEFVKLSKLDLVFPWHFKGKVNGRSREELSSVTVKRYVDHTSHSWGQEDLLTALEQEEFLRFKKGEGHHAIISAVNLPETILLQSTLAKRCACISGRALGLIREGKEARWLTRWKQKDPESLSFVNDPTPSLAHFSLVRIPFASLGVRVCLSSV